MSEKKLKPLADRVFVKPSGDNENKTKSGIILTETATHGQKVYGTVVSVSDGYYTASYVP